MACLTHEPNQCERNADCITLPIWQGLYRTITEYLDGITLQDILRQQPAELLQDAAKTSKWEESSRVKIAKKIGDFHTELFILNHRPQNSSVQIKLFI